MNKRDIKRMIKARKQYEKTLKICGGYSISPEIQIKSVPEMAKVTGTEVTRHERSSRQYKWEYRTIFCGELFSSIHTVAEDKIIRKGEKL